MKNRKFSSLVKRHRSTLVALVLLSGSCWVAYSNIFSNQFVWDDTSFILGWPETRQFWVHILDFFRGNVPLGHEGLYRPLRSIFYGISFQLWGINPFGYHFQSLAIHTAATLLVYFLVKKLSDSKLLAFISGLIFAVHPVHVEAITWITPNFDIIGVISAVTSIYLYISWRKTNKKILLFAALALAAFAYFTNEITLVVAGIIAWYDLCFSKNNNSIFVGIRKNLLTWISLLTPALIYLLVRFFLLDIGAREEYLYGSKYLTALLMSVSAVKQLLIFLWPFNLTVNQTIFPGFTALFYHEHSLRNLPKAPEITQWQIWMSITLISALLYGAFKLRKRYPLLAFFVGWHFLAVLPLMQIVPQSIIFGERYLYFASFATIPALVLLVKNFIDKIFPRYAPQLLLLLGCFLAVTLGFLTYQRNKDWSSEKTLWQATLDVGPRTPYALSNLAKYYYETGDTQQAKELLEESYEINPDHLIAVSNLGLLYSAEGEYEKALKLHQHIYSIAPKYAPNIEKMGAAYLRQNNYFEAISWYKLYRDLNPNSLEAQLKLANVFHTAVVIDQAENEYLKALEISPENPLVLSQLAELYMLANRDEEAAALREQVAKTYPDFTYEPSKVEVDTLE